MCFAPGGALVPVAANISMPPPRSACTNSTSPMIATYPFNALSLHRGLLATTEVP